MELALTHPTSGYYSRTHRLLRHGGDFSTAPAISPFFNRTLARLVTELADAALEVSPGGRPSVVELGGGEGHLAAGILRFWATERPEMRDELRYRIVEVGAHLRRRQAAAVAEWVGAGWDIDWGSDLAEASADTQPVVMVANEFLDTVPVHLVTVRGDTIREAYVETVELGLAQTWGEPSEKTRTEIERLFGTIDPLHLRPFSEDGMLEIFPGLDGLLCQVAGLMPFGSLVNVDYGEWFPGLAPCGQTWGLEDRARRRRSVRGYFRHQTVMDLLARPGRQDLTADVDFAAVDYHGRQHGFQTILFTTLAAFLRAGGADDEIQALRAGSAPAAPDPLESDRQATVLRNLLDERDLGSAYKLLVQVKEQ
jgi:SAM-dependent MidA family methyltransferase